MGKRRFNTAAMGFIILIVLVVGFLMSGSLRRTSHVALPDTTHPSTVSPDSSQYGEDAVNKIEITPETVQSAIATLQRPGSYIQILVVEWLWENTSALSKMTAYVHDTLTRVDSVKTDGGTRHVVTDGIRTAVWYDDEAAYYIGNAGDVSADQEQSLPTYEEILLIDPQQIAKADYRVFSEENCIFVETIPDEYGIVQRYWVSVASGLLIGAERMEDGITFYRVASQQITRESTLTEQVFLLPDGTNLHDSR
ncbi:MAG: hypothetical protein E7445_00635 [Ruminococcaceae bacterium]|nr:hypothetical protein [Oscillospiraceae bacterium]